MTRERLRIYLNEDLRWLVNILRTSHSAEQGKIKLDAMLQDTLTTDAHRRILQKSLDLCPIENGELQALIIVKHNVNMGTRYNGRRSTV